MKKFASALALAGSLALVGAGAAQAAPSAPFYVPGPSQGTVSDATVAPGETVIFSGSGFLPGETIEITVDFQPTEPTAGTVGGGGRLGASIGGAIPMAIVFEDTTTADANGNFSYPITLEEEGVYTLTATGVESGQTVTAVVVVDAAFAGAPVAGGGADAADDMDAAAGVGLANTGVDASLLLWGAAGIGALGLGAASVIVSRRRASTEA